MILELVNQRLDREAVVCHRARAQVQLFDIKDQRRVLVQLQDDSRQLNHVFVFLPEQLSREHGPVEVDIGEVARAKHRVERLLLVRFARREH